MCADVPWNYSLTRCDKINAHVLHAHKQKIVLNITTKTTDDNNGENNNESCKVLKDAKLLRSANDTRKNRRHYRWHVATSPVACTSPSPTGVTDVYDWSSETYNHRHARAIPYKQNTRAHLKLKHTLTYMTLIAISIWPRHCSFICSKAVYTLETDWNFSHPS